MGLPAPLIIISHHPDHARSRETSRLQDWIALAAVLLVAAPAAAQPVPWSAILLSTPSRASMRPRCASSDRARPARRSQAGGLAQTSRLPAAAAGCFRFNVRLQTIAAEGRKARSGAGTAAVQVVRAAAQRIGHQHHRHTRPGEEDLKQATFMPSR